MCLRALGKQDCSHNAFMYWKTNPKLVFVLFFSLKYKIGKIDVYVLMIYFLRTAFGVCCFNVRLAGGHLYGEQLFTWLSLVVSLMASFVLSFFPLDVLDEIWDLIESVYEGFLTYS